MPNNEQIAKEYYSFIGEGAVCPKEDKNIKDNDQVVRRLKKTLAKFAKENDLEIRFFRRKKILIKTGHLTSPVSTGYLYQLMHGNRYHQTALTLVYTTHLIWVMSRFGVLSIPNITAFFLQ